MTGPWPMIDNGTTARYERTYPDGTTLWKVWRKPGETGWIYGRDGRTTVKSDRDGMIGRGVYGAGPNVLFFADVRAALAEIARLFEENEAARVGDPESRL